MKPTNSFSLRRLMMLGRKHYIENGRTYLFTLLVLLVVIAAVSIFTVVKKVDYGFFEILFFMAIMIVPLFVAKVSMVEYYITKRQMISYTLPATQSEKYIWAVANTLVISLISYVLVEIAASITLGIIPDKSIYAASFVGNWFSGCSDNINLMLLFCSTMILACTASKDNPARSFAIVIVTYTLLGFLPHMIMSPDSTVMLNSGVAFPPMVSAQLSSIISEGNTAILFTINSSLGRWATNLCSYLAPVIMLTAGYFKFRERQMR